MNAKAARKTKQVASPWHEYVIGNLIVIGLIDAIIAGVIFALDKPVSHRVHSLNAEWAAFLVPLYVTCAYLFVAYRIRIRMSEERKQTGLQYFLGIVAMLAVFLTSLYHLVTGSFPLDLMLIGTLGTAFTSVAMLTFISDS